MTYIKPGCLINIDSFTGRNMPNQEHLDDFIIALAKMKYA